MLLLILSSCMIICAALPEHISRNMNENVNPCEDFYGFACGNWSEGRRGGIDASSYVAHLDHRYNKELIKALEEQRQWDQEPRFVQQLRNNYLSCRDLRYNYDAAQLTRTLYDQERNDIRVLLVIQLEMLGWGRYLKGKIPDTMGDPIDPIKVWFSKPDMEKFVTRRLLLGHVGKFVPLTRRVYNHLYSAMEPLNKPKRTLWQSIIKMEKRIKDVLEYEEKKKEHDKKRKKEQEYAQVQGDLILGLRDTKMLHSYQQLRLFHRLQRLPAPRFTKVECAGQTRMLLPHAADWLLEQQLSQEQHHQRRSQVQLLFLQLRQQLAHQVWLNRNHFDEPTKMFLLQKLYTMHLRLGLMPAGELIPAPKAMEMTDWTALDKMDQQLLEQDYASLQLDASDYFGNQWAICQKLSSRPELISPESVEISAMMINPPFGFSSNSITYFIPEYNMLVVPQSLLASPFYQQHHQDAVDRLSNLGFLLAHEMSHALSRERKLFAWTKPVASAMGELFQSKRFDRKVNDLFSRYKEKSEEKFCDFNGIDLAYGVFVIQQPQQEQQQHRQFFLNFAQYFCGEELEEQGEDDDLDYYGSNRYRVNDAVATLKGFSIAFDCPNAEEQRNLQLF